MNTLKWIVCLALCGLLAACGQRQENSGGTSDQVTTGTGRGAIKPNNTGVNERDRSGDSLTPGDQAATDADREMTRRVRRAITSNDQLSTDAKNIKIITVNGKVTLRGPVKDANEKQMIQSVLQQAGVTSFDNQLELKSANQ